MKIAGLFPGQGSQQVGMGESFLTTDIGNEIFKKADRALGFAISKLAFAGPLETLTLTENAQPAILTCSYAAYVAADIKLDCAAGHSLGEYTALVAAQVISFEDAVALVHKRGRYMQEAVSPAAGKMIAVMGPSEEEIREALKSAGTGVCEIANLNSPGQTVLAGDKAGVEAASKILTEKGAKVIPLNVSAPFHCSLMKPAAEKLAKDLEATTFNDPIFPVYANITAEPVTKGKDARELLKRQVCGSVRWTDSVLAMVGQAAVTHFVEFGPGGVLSKLVKRISGIPKRIEIGNFAAIESAKASLAS